MKNLILLLTLWIIAHAAHAGCTSPISRINLGFREILGYQRYNQDMNTVYTKINALPGDCINDATITTAKIEDAAITAAKLAPAVLANYLPAGAVLPYVGTSAPTGFLLCNGQAVSRVTYAALYAVIGDSHGSGNGSTTFNVPDYRGRFMRGVDGGAGRDPDRLTRTAMNSGGSVGDNVGTVQDDEFEAHTHTLALSTNDNANQAPQITGDSNTTGTTSSAGGTSETRPKNANVNFIIKY